MRSVFPILILSGAFAQTPDALHKHVAYLASDELKGRSIPSSGLDAAANYIAARFKEIGLEDLAHDNFTRMGGVDGVVSLFRLLCVMPL